MDAVLDLFKVLFEPTAVFERVRERPRFLAPFLVLALITVVIVALQLPYTRAALAQTPNMTPEQIQAASKFAPIGLVIAPIFYGLFLALNGLILWVSVSVLGAGAGGETKYGTLLSVATYASIAYTLLQVIGVIVLTMRGTSSITSMVDLQPSLGLDLLAPDTKGFPLALLRGINPFTLYGLFLTATGVAVTNRTSKGVAYTAATIQFVISLLIGAALSRG